MTAPAKVRTLIVDDEPLARERLRQLLEKESNFEIVDECGDGRQALESIQHNAPDLVFLDVQMPEMDGFEVLAALPLEKLPSVIFVTAYDQFAVRAFEVNAVDYLLKPFDRERFQKAMERALARRQQDDMDRLPERFAALLNEFNLQGGRRPSDRLAVKTDGRVVLLKLAEIDWIEAADNYVQIHVGQQTHMLRETLTALENRLDPNIFLRISRSTIVNLERIKELQPMFHGDYVVLLHNGERLNLSRGYRDRLNRLLGKES